MQLSLSLPDITLKAGFTNRWHHLQGSSTSLAIAQLAQQHSGPVVVLCSQSSQVQRFEREIAQFSSHTQQPVITFPDWEILPYDYFSAHESIVSERLECLHQLPSLKQGVVITSLSTTATRLSPRSFIAGNMLVLKPGDQMDLSAARSAFEASGYHCVNKVMEHGEFAVRGSLLDLYPMGADTPYRIDFFDDEIESIRLFDPESQLSTETINQIELLPAHEFPNTDEAIARFRQNFRGRFDVELKDCPIYQDVSNGLLPAGIEFYLPLFNDDTCSFFDYLPENTLLLTVGELQQTQQQFWQELTHRYEERRGDRTRPLLTPEEICLTPEQSNQHIKQFARVDLNGKDEKSSHALATSLLPDIAINHKLKDPLQDLRNYLQQQPKPVVICAESAGRREVILELCQRHQLTIKVHEHWADIETSQSLSLIVAPIDESFAAEHFVLIAESQLFGQHVLQRRRRKSNKTAYDPDAVIHSLAELKEGDPVVHVEQGVGRYLGLQCLTVADQPAEYLTLEYSGGDKLYVPVQSLHLIHRYSGTAEGGAPWHKLGSEQWEKARKKAAEKVRDVAAELLDLYAKRAARPGFQYKTQDDDYLKFADSFPFELTDDQDNSIQAIQKDMAASTPMDRLVCGDVGFGKTEVAIRAAFIAVQNGRQVAVLVPTTLLAQQHYETFKDRLAEWPFRIDVLSRFKTAKEQAATFDDAEAGKVDIIIGTHKLIQGNLKFKQLGLVIIDEEHRFGVRQKEQLKALRSEVDILTLTATPIPRTLNMSLSGMRDLSIIATPPARRLAIKTFVREYNMPLIREAIQRETMRGGQVYFLHNSVDTIEKRARELEELMPELNIGVAHGQMRERELEQIMQQFYHQRFHVLLCTTIIETGIDVPNANTIIMERADKLGLAQLHQLRGRVGRSHHQAYAYLLTPSIKTLTKDAKKRLDAISSLEDLGAGFSLATHDMEIRGCGEILGEDQSGQMEGIGFSLYMEMLENAVEAIKDGKEPTLHDSLATQTQIDLGIPALIPEDYIPDVHTRLTLYKEIANAKKSQALRDIQVSMIDRFGLLPDHVKQLVAITELKLKLTPLGITRLTATEKGLTCEFNPDTVVDPAKIIHLIQSNPARYRLEKGTVLKVNRPLSDVVAKVNEVESLIETLSR
ncbi:transcription-repair coupling factor [Pleionea sp. CnH1-48]|uniref:transcription-repair coupling factor n=1 Tax=Pleionea sp. CnH1-48 TaxID=2954494 RepID=UPI0020972D2E|nr:transcription-repair coupling factor [Pleionea sp. CnH1-48]MCO7226007.1 transcription-repair coupling factor [Pleionea sp. CnH1-48]